MEMVMVMALFESIEVSHFIEDLHCFPQDNEKFTAAFSSLSDVGILFEKFIEQIFFVQCRDEFTLQIVLRTTHQETHNALRHRVL